MNRRILLLTVGLVPGIFCGAPAVAQTRLAIKAGVSLADTDFSNENQFEGWQFRPVPTFYAGLMTMEDFSNGFSGSIGLQLQGGGYQTDGLLQGAAAKGTVNVYYLQVPFLAYYRFDRFFVSAGPYIGLGWFGRQQNEYSGVVDNLPVGFTNDVDGSTLDQKAFIFRPLDYGVNGEFGIDFSTFYLTVTYSRGLANVQPRFNGQSSGVTARFSAISVGAAYFFLQKS